MTIREAVVRKLDKLLPDPKEDLELPKLYEDVVYAMDRAHQMEDAHLSEAQQKALVPTMEKVRQGEGDTILKRGHMVALWHSAIRFFLEPEEWPAISEKDELAIQITATQCLDKEARDMTCLKQIVEICDSLSISLVVVLD